MEQEAARVLQKSIYAAVATADAKHPPEEFLPDKPRSIYKVVPSKVWMNQDGRVNGYFVDGRAVLDLKKLQTLLAPK